MSNRLDKEREARLSQIRMATAIDRLTKIGFVVKKQNEMGSFIFKGSRVRYYPYSGWATGAAIKDGRGLDNLLKQLTCKSEPK